MVTRSPLGFTLGPGDWDEPLPAVVALDGSFDLHVCADSFDEFLYRFWIESELCFSDDEDLDEPFRSSAALLEQE